MWSEVSVVSTSREVPVSKILKGRKIKRVYSLARNSIYE